MKTLSEQLNALPVLDSLKREEAELDGGDWNPLWWNRGRVLSGGWRTKSEELFATAIWISDLFPAPCAVRATLNPFFPLGRSLQLGLLTESGEEPGCWLQIDSISYIHLKLTLASQRRGQEFEVLATTEVPMSFADGLVFALTFEEGEGGLKGFRQSASEEWTEVLSATGPEGLGSDFGEGASLTLYGEAPWPITEKVTDFRAGQLETEPEIAGPLGTFRLATATTLKNPITKPDDILICQWWNEERIKAGKEKGSRVLIYQNLTRAHEPEGEAGLYASGLTLKEAEELGAATEEEDGDAGMICLPGTPGYAEAWLTAATARAEEVEADGVFCDDMNTWSEGGGSEEVTEAEWLEQMQACNAIVGPGLTEAGLLSIANMAGATGQRNAETEGWVEEQFQFYDGGLDEFFVTWPEETVQPPFWIEEAQEIMRRVQLDGKLYLAATNGKEGIVGFAIGLVLLETIGYGRCFSTGTPVDYGTQTWTKALEDGLALGLPIAGKIKIGSEEWSRQFENGSVVVDFGEKTATIEV